jgi:hypothetical protein
MPGSANAIAAASSLVFVNVIMIDLSKFVAKMPAIHIRFVPGVKILAPRELAPNGAGARLGVEICFTQGGTML